MVGYFDMKLINQIIEPYLQWKQHKSFANLRNIMDKLFEPEASTFYRLWKSIYNIASGRYEKIYLQYRHVYEKYLSEQAIKSKEV